MRTETDKAAKKLAKELLILGNFPESDKKQIIVLTANILRKQGFESIASLIDSISRTNW